MNDHEAVGAEQNEHLSRSETLEGSLTEVPTACADTQTLKKLTWAKLKQAAEINKFIEALARVQSPGNVFNQYSYDLNVNFIKRNNLALYLQQMAELTPQMLLVGEAPGYRGCRLTGVPFTSEFILLNGLEDVDLFGQSKGYRKTDELAKICKESSATIIWQTLVNHRPIPLIWNAFPFHPFHSGQAQSNRMPTKDELKIGNYFLQELIQLFNIQRLVAVGNTAEATIKTLGMAYQKVRHPSHGGKSQFTTDIKAVMKTLKR